MKLIGDFKVFQDKSVGVWSGAELLKPYLFLHPKLNGMKGTEEVTLAPAVKDLPHVLNGLVPLENEDHMLLWFCCASHVRFRVQRSLTRNAVIVHTGEWGSTVIAICRDDYPAELTFHRGSTVETATLDGGVVVRSVSQQDPI